MELDGYTKQGALRLASKIQLYWITKGAIGINTWIEPIYTLESGDTLYQVKSNIAEKLGGSSNCDSLLWRERPSTVH